MPNKHVRRVHITMRRRYQRRRISMILKDLLQGYNVSVSSKSADNVCSIR